MQGGIGKGLQLVQHLNVLSSSTSHIDVFQSWSHEFLKINRGFSQNSVWYIYYSTILLIYHAYCLTSMHSIYFILFFNLFAFG